MVTPSILREMPAAMLHDAVFCTPNAPRAVGANCLTIKELPPTQLVDFQLVTSVTSSNTLSIKHLQYFLCITLCDFLLHRVTRRRHREHRDSSVAPLLRKCLPITGGNCGWICRDGARPVSTIATYLHYPFTIHPFTLSPSTLSTLSTSVEQHQTIKHNS